jgi:hypothetical protein
MAARLAAFDGVKRYDKSGDAADSALLNICPLEFRRRAISVFATGTSLFARLRKRRVVSGGSCVARRFQIKLAVRFTYVQYSTLECAGAGVFTFWVRLAPLARSHNRRLENGWTSNDAGAAKGRRWTAAGER